MDLYTQYKILKKVGKHFVLPIFKSNINNIASCLYIINNVSNVNNKTIDIKNELATFDLEYKIMTILSFLEEVNEETFNSQTIHMHLCGICEILEKLGKILDEMRIETEYIQNSWYYYTLGWMWYKSTFNFTEIKKLSLLLDSRYKALLDILLVKKS